MKKNFEIEELMELPASEHASQAFASAERAHLAMQVHGLLNALREMEVFADRLGTAQFHSAIRDAVLACGFADEVDAWQGIMSHLRSGICHEPSCWDRAPRV